MMMVMRWDELWETQGWARTHASQKPMQTRTCLVHRRDVEVVLQQEVGAEERGGGGQGGEEGVAGVDALEHLPCVFLFGG